MADRAWTMNESIIRGTSSDLVAHEDEEDAGDGERSHQLIDAGDVISTSGNLQSRLRHRHRWNIPKQLSDAMSWSDTECFANSSLKC